MRKTSTVDNLSQGAEQHPSCEPQSHFGTSTLTVSGRQMYNATYRSGQGCDEKPLPVELCNRCKLRHDGTMWQCDMCLTLNFQCSVRCIKCDRFLDYNSQLSVECASCHSQSDPLARNQRFACSVCGCQGYFEPIWDPVWIKTVHEKMQTLHGQLQLMLYHRAHNSSGVGWLGLTPKDAFLHGPLRGKRDGRYVDLVLQPFVEHLRSLPPRPCCHQPPCAHSPEGSRSEVSECGPNAFDVWSHSTDHGNGNSKGDGPGKGGGDIDPATMTKEEFQDAMEDDTDSKPVHVPRKDRVDRAEVVCRITYQEVGVSKAGKKYFYTPPQIPHKCSPQEGHAIEKAQHTHQLLLYEQDFVRAKSDIHIMPSEMRSKVGKNRWHAMEQRSAMGTVAIVLRGAKDAKVHQYIAKGQSKDGSDPQGAAPKESGDKLPNVQDVPQKSKPNDKLDRKIGALVSQCTKEDGTQCQKVMTTVEVQAGVSGVVKARQDVAVGVDVVQVEAPTQYRDGDLRPVSVSCSTSGLAARDVILQTDEHASAQTEPELAEHAAQTPCAAPCETRLSVEHFEPIVATRHPKRKVVVDHPKVYGVAVSGPSMFRFNVMVPLTPWGSSSYRPVRYFSQVATITNLERADFSLAQPIWRCRATLEEIHEARVVKSCAPFCERTIEDLFPHNYRVVHSATSCSDCTGYYAEKFCGNRNPTCFSWVRTLLFGKRPLQPSQPHPFAVVGQMARVGVVPEAIAVLTSDRQVSWNPIRSTAIHVQCMIGVQEEGCGHMSFGAPESAVEWNDRQSTFRRLFVCRQNWHAERTSGRVVGSVEPRWVVEVCYRFLWFRVLATTYVALPFFLKWLCTIDIDTYEANTKMHTEACQGSMVPTVDHACKCERFRVDAIDWSAEPARPASCSPVVTSLINEMRVADDDTPLQIHANALLNQAEFRRIKLKPDDLSRGATFLRLRSNQFARHDMNRGMVTYTACCGRPARMFLHTAYSGFCRYCGSTNVTREGRCARCIRSTRCQCGQRIPDHCGCLACAAGARPRGQWQQERSIVLRYLNGQRPLLKSGFVQTEAFSLPTVAGLGKSFARPKALTIEFKRDVHFKPVMPAKLLGVAADVCFPVVYQPTQNAWLQTLATRVDPKSKMDPFADYQAEFVVFADHFMRQFRGQYVSCFDLFTPAWYKDFEDALKGFPEEKRKVYRRAVTTFRRQGGLRGNIRFKGDFVTETMIKLEKKMALEGLHQLGMFPPTDQIEMYTVSEDQCDAMDAGGSGLWPYSPGYDGVAFQYPLSFLSTGRCIQYLPANILGVLFLIVAHKTLRWMKRVFSSGPYVYAGCRDAVETGALFDEWRERGLPMFEGDFSKFDAYQRGDLLTTEMLLRKILHPMIWKQPLYAQALKQQSYRVKSTARGKFRFSCPSKRQSGDYFTTTANSLNNLLFTAYACAKSVCNVRGLQFRPEEAEAILREQNFRLLFNGDDHVVQLRDSSLIGEMADVMLRLGLPVKYRKATVQDQRVTFLGGFPVRANVDGVEQMVIVPELTRFLTSLPWKLSPMNDEDWRRGVAIGWTPLLGTIPVYSTFIETLAPLRYERPGDVYHELQRLDPAWRYHVHRTTSHHRVKCTTNTLRDLATRYFGSDDDVSVGRFLGLDMRLKTTFRGQTVGVIRDDTLDEMLGFSLRS